MHETFTLIPCQCMQTVKIWSQLEQNLLRSLHSFHSDPSLVSLKVSHGHRTGKNTQISIEAICIMIVSSDLYFFIPFWGTLTWFQGQVAVWKLKLKVTFCWQCQQTDAQMLLGSWDSLLVEHHTCDWKAASLSPGRSGRRIFFSRDNFLCWP